MALSCALAAILLFSPQQDFLAEGMKALDANQPAAAETLLRQAVQADTNDFSAHFNLALSLSLQQKDDEAILELRRTLELKPGLYQADSNLGTLLLRNKRPAEALPVLKEAAASAAEGAARKSALRPGAVPDRGFRRRRSSTIRAAIELDPKSAAAQSGLANSLLKESRPADSAEHFRAAAALDPQYRNDLLTLAGEYEKARMIPQAIAIYREFPENAAAKERVAQLIAATGDAADAVPALEQAAKAIADGRESTCAGGRVQGEQADRQGDRATAAGGVGGAEQL